LAGSQSTFFRRTGCLPSLPLPHGGLDEPALCLTSRLVCTHVVEQSWRS
jgi:hypothetical protein